MPDLPSGTVTFLFTDIEGSTALWERDRAAMADGRRAPPRAPATRRSRPMAASSSRPSAMRSRPPSRRLPPPLPPLSTASVRCSPRIPGGRAACGCGWRCMPGRRSRTSAATTSRRRSTGWPGCWRSATAGRSSSRRRCGNSRAGRPARRRRACAISASTACATCSKPEQVFQLLHPDLPDAFPPLSSLEARPHNLPTQPTPFLGREREVAEVVALLRSPTPAC